LSDASSGLIVLLDHGDPHLMLLADRLIDASKARVVLSALRSAGSLQQYVAVYLSEAALASACGGVVREHPDISAQAVLSDYEHALNCEEL
jgi:uncharacterized SAM-dependent methyltransferase